MNRVLLLGVIGVSCSSTKEVQDPVPTVPVTTTEGTVRFVVLGDAGMGNQAQYDVAEAIKNVCAQRGCDFALYLGDNFYDTGVSSIDDSQFIDKFELPYANLDFPFYKYHDSSFLLIVQCGV